MIKNAKVQKGGRVVGATAGSDGGVANIKQIMTRAVAAAIALLNCVDFTQLLFSLNY